MSASTRAALGLVVAPAYLPGGAFAGPFQAPEGGQDGFPIPADKKLDPQWVRSLFERGTPEQVGQEDSEFIGMPVGGFFAGTVYLGGDGRLWNWDIFNQPHEGGVARPNLNYRGQSLRERDGANYVDPPIQQSPFLFEIAVQLEEEEERKLDRRGWAQTSFRGEYPVGTVDFEDPGTPLKVQLQAFSPFVPLDVEDSSFPAIVLRYTLTNHGEQTLRGRIFARSEIPVLIHSRERPEYPGCIGTEAGLHSGAGVSFTPQLHPVLIEDPSWREDIPFEDFESGSHGGWVSEGSAFGEKPRHVDDIASYQGDLNAQGDYLVNSHNTRQGEDVGAGDRHTGTLTSPEFLVERNFIHFRIGGGQHPGRTCLNLVVGGEVVASASGRNANAMTAKIIDVRKFQGRRARLVVVDQESGPWGNIGVDDLVFSDRPPEPIDPTVLPDYGSFCVACSEQSAWLDFPNEEDPLNVQPEDKELVRVGCDFELAPGERRTIPLLVSWHFPNLQIPGLPGQQRWYAEKWDWASEVMDELIERLDELTESTLRWRDTWYDSSLPYWLLDRSFIPISTLATSTCHRFRDGRYWLWEGIGCCAGTCTHVWGYAQGIGRLFPEIERDLRERIDFGMAFHDDTGAIDYRAEFARHVAHDGQCGCILRAYREHLMSADDAYLRRVWPRVRKAMEYMIGEDTNGDGLLEGAQYNTLDAAWYGPMAWLSSLYLAAAAASAEMAERMGDDAFAAHCRSLVQRGSTAAVEQLYDGEFFIHRPDPQHPEANSTNAGCHIDQVFGQAWAHQVGLGRVLPAAETRSALASLWKYNFAPDVGVYRDWMKTIQGGRWYAVPGDAGLLMCTFPKGGAERATGKGQSAWAAMYMNECMTGFEYQVAAHMVWEGLVEEGLAITRAIHDRYSPRLRNPFNEIECSDHYGRALAGYGVFLAACGWHYDGPAGRVAIAPRLHADAFRAAFTAARGWGTLGQERAHLSGGDVVQRHWIEVRHGDLRLRELEVQVPQAAQEWQGMVEVRVVAPDGNERVVAAIATQAQGSYRIQLGQSLTLAAGEVLRATARWTQA